MKKMAKKRNSVVFSVALPTEHDDLSRIIERCVIVWSQLINHYHNQNHQEHHHAPLNIHLTQYRMYSNFIFMEIDYKTVKLYA